MFAKSTFLPTVLMIVSLFIISDFLFSQSPEGINYQAVFRNPSGTIVAGQELQNRNCKKSLREYFIR